MLKIKTADIITYVFFVFILFVCNNAIYAQKAFPSFGAEDVRGKNVNFPKDIIGKKSLVGFAFSRKSQDELEGWLEPVYYEFIDTNTLASLVYDANVYLVISLSDANAGFKNKIVRELKENILPEFYPHVLITETGPKELMGALGLSDDVDLHIFTLDPLGDVTFRTQGAYTDKKFEQVATYLEIE